MGCDPSLGRSLSGPFLRRTANHTEPLAWDSVALSSCVKFKSSPAYIYRRSQRLVHSRPTGIGLCISSTYAGDDDAASLARRLVSSRRPLVYSVYHDNPTLIATPMVAGLPWTGTVERPTCLILSSVLRGFGSGSLFLTFLSMLVPLLTLHFRLLLLPLSFVSSPTTLLCAHLSFLSLLLLLGRTSIRSRVT